MWGGARGAARGPNLAHSPPPPLPPLSPTRSEYNDALAADAAAAARAAEEARAAAAAHAAAAARAAEAADAAELARAVELSIELDKEGAVGAARARLAAAPEPDGAAAAGAAVVRVALPSGARVQRRFAPDAPLALVADFALVASEELGAPLPPGGFNLATAQPRRVYDCATRAAADAAATLQALGLARGATLMVQLR
jgi:hypothetical protein